MLYSCRGFIRSFQKVYDTALLDFEKALRIDPKNINAYVARTSVWTFRKEWDKAIVEFSRIIAIDPYRARAYLGRGACKAAKGEF